VWFSRARTSRWRVWRVIINRSWSPSPSGTDELVVRQGTFREHDPLSLVDRGDPDVSDADGTRSDIGARGGPEGW